MPRARQRRQAEDRRDAQVCAQDATPVVASWIVKATAHDSRRWLRHSTEDGLLHEAPGRRVDRARLILPETLSEQTGLAPGMWVQIILTDDGALRIEPLPGFAHLAPVWSAERTLRINRAEQLQLWAVEQCIVHRVPYDQVGRSARKQRRRLEARRGIPRDWPHGTAPTTDPD